MLLGQVKFPGLGSFMKDCRCVCVSLRGWRLRQGRPRLSTVSNLYEDRLRDKHFIFTVCNIRYKP